MGNGDAKSVQVSVDAILQAEATLGKICDGELSTRLSVDFESKEMRQLVERVNQVVSALEQRAEEMHNASMDLALGLSDCFQALTRVQAGDLTARVNDETMGSEDELLTKFARSLNQTLAEIQSTIDRLERQQYAIRRLSTPVLQIWDDVLALPVIGVVDSQRGVEIMESLLAAIVDKQAKHVILDITGVDIVDTKMADHFIKVVNAAQLLGTNCMLTGIQPAVAQTLVDLGVDLSNIRTLRNLREGLKECLRHSARQEARRQAPATPAKTTA